ncbi:MAG: hypothetical protein IKT09_06740 [Synergistes sp.]|nr:hypothetical protein [Synergistes sp.]
MKAKIAKAAGAAAKVIIISAVLVSFVFIGWRVWTKNAYTAREKAACRAMAVSAALCAADAVSYDEAAASFVKESKSVEYISDHRKMPENINVSIKISSDGSSFLIQSHAASGWNSRSPQSDSFSLRLDERGKIIFESDADAEAADLVAEALRDIGRGEKHKEHKFTFPNERPCPAPFSAKSAEAGGFDEKKVWIVFYDGKND